MAAGSWVKWLQSHRGSVGHVGFRRRSQLMPLTPSICEPRLSFQSSVERVVKLLTVADAEVRFWRTSRPTLSGGSGSSCPWDRPSDLRCQRGPVVDLWRACDSICVTCAKLSHPIWAKHTRCKLSSLSFSLCIRESLCSAAAVKSPLSQKEQRKVFINLELSGNPTPSESSAHFIWHTSYLKNDCSIQTAQIIILNGCLSAWLGTAGHKLDGTVLNVFIFTVFPLFCNLSPFFFVEFPSNPFQAFWFNKRVRVQWKRLKHTLTLSFSGEHVSHFRSPVWIFGAGMGFHARDPLLLLLYLLKQQHCTVPIAALYKTRLFSIHSVGLFPLIWKVSLRYVKCLICSLMLRTPLNSINSVSSRADFWL